ncbi:MAG: histidine kinase,Response regulator receiver domain proteinhistidine kinase [Phycisphaerales bacterium]|nr:histidine kinase,Response regulator receiver domain proteinhistidine kinase [Phycisphaerales bacterium]
MRTRHTILVVDDEPDVVKSVQDLLRLDYRVLGATRARDAMEIMRREDVHVVMTDQRMPEMTGVEFLGRLRSEHPHAVRLLFTGYADIRAVIDAINEGNVYRYITKPWEPEELETTIRQAVERHDLMVERDELLKTLQAKNAELEHANAQLKHANDLKQAFIQVASHELRTPLTILLGLVQLSRQQSAASDPMSPMLARIEAAGRRLQRLVDQLVKMLGAGAFDRTLETQPTDVAALLNEAADDVRPFTNLRHQTLAIEAPADLGTMNVEAAKMRDVLGNLLLNAVKFTPDGGRVTLGARRIPGAMEIRVTDTGSGIEPASRAQLFEPFFTGFDVSHHSSGQYEHGRRGLGLGLSIARAFVEMHGGTISCESKTGEGSVFTITLPEPCPSPSDPARI